MAIATMGLAGAAVLTVAGTGQGAAAGVPEPTDPPELTISPELTVSEVIGLDPLGHVVTVSGSGYDPERGVYVAVCAMPAPGEVPTPCGGGIDLTGESAASVWISSDPPDYGDGLAQSYGPEGSFEVELTVSATLTSTIDCREVQCAIVTRADHLRLTDRSLDVIVPIWFRPDAEPVPEPEPEPDAAFTDEEELEPPRGAAAVWPVWAVSGVAAVGLVAAHPRWNRHTRGARASEGEQR